MKNYTAQYECTKCGAVKSVTAAAFDWRASHLKLPRWLYPDNHKMRRIHGPIVERKKDEN
jgi:hypothetical protein